MDILTHWTYTEVTLVLLLRDTKVQCPEALQINDNVYYYEHVLHPVQGKLNPALMI